jgi:hypothetical protein
MNFSDIIPIIGYMSVRSRFTGKQQDYNKRSIQSQSQSHIATDSQSISKSWCRAPSVAHDQIFITVWQLRSCFCGAPSLRRGRVCLLYTSYAAGPRQRSLSPVRVPWDSWPYFTLSDLRLPFSSSPTTRRVTVEVFEPASTRVLKRSIEMICN